MTFVEPYQQNLKKTRVLSKIASFLIAVILLVEVFTNANDLLFTNFRGTEAWRHLLKLLIFQASIGILFLTRFIFLCLNKSKSLWASQTIWVIGWLSIFAYLWTFIFSHSDENAISHSYWTLSSSKNYLATIPYFYLLLSPIHQFLHLSFAFFHRK